MSHRRRRTILAAAVASCQLFGWIALAWAERGEEDFAPIAGGKFAPLYPDTESSPPPKATAKNPPVKLLTVSPFLLARYPVTKSDFLAFITEHPQWRRSQIKTLFADTGYLKSWNSDMEYSGKARQPVTEVSWFAAKAYCQARGARLPTILEWEYAGRASETEIDGQSDASFQSRILSWYSEHDSQSREVGNWKNVYGIFDMHGLVWEWVADFNSALIASESRGDARNELNLFCGGGAASATEKQKSDYAAFMRFAFRSSLGGTFCLPTLGFRCAKDAN